MTPSSPSQTSRWKLPSQDPTSLIGGGHYRPVTGRQRRQRWQRRRRRLFLLSRVLSVCREHPAVEWVLTVYRGLLDVERVLTVGQDRSGASQWSETVALQRQLSCVGECVIARTTDSVTDLDQRLTLFICLFCVKTPTGGRAQLWVKSSTTRANTQCHYNQST